MSGHIKWNDTQVAFEIGETVAQALNRADIRVFGQSRTGQTGAVFCGIGQCQGCLVLVDGTVPREACLLPCHDGLALMPIGEGRA